jgi:hypothetical protein
VGIFVPVARAERSNTGRSIKIFENLPDGSERFIGFLSRKDVNRLLRGENKSRPICKYVEQTPETAATLTSLDFSLRLSKPEEEI